MSDSSVMVRAAASRITQHALGYWQSSVLFELLASEIVDDLLDGPRSDTDLAASRGLNPVATAALLRAGQALGVTSRDDRGWIVASSARPFLSWDSPTCLRHWFQVMARWQEPWAGLDAAVRSAAGGGGSAKLEDDPEYVRDFVVGMHEFARLSSDAVIEAAGTAFPAEREFGRVLDVGGGAGTYSLAAIRRAPRATATVLDQPAVTSIAQMIALAEGLGDRLTTVDADYRGSYGTESYDTVLFSNVLHQESDETAVAMICEGRRVAATDGAIVVHTHLIDEQRPKLFPALQGVSAFVLWSGGAGMTEQRLRMLIERSGLALESLDTVRDSGTAVAVCR